MQIIFHIDLNAFFVNAEITKNASLLNKPVVIAHDSRRSIVSTASYEARKYGIHSAMPLYLAKEKCKNLVIVEPHFELYRSLSKQFFNIIRRYSKIVEIASIDECYVDITDYIVKNNVSPEKLALEIQTIILEEISLPCSIGIAPNKFMAKMASDLKKPLGITVINKSNYKEILWPLPIEDMFGVGKKTYPKLKKIGIKTIGDLANYKDYYLLKPILGKNAIIYVQHANGIDRSRVHNEPFVNKSIGKSTTFEHDTNDDLYIKSVLRRLTENVVNQLKRKELLTNNISVNIKYDLEKVKSKQMILPEYTDDFEIIYFTVIELFDELYDFKTIRLAGMSANHLIQKRNVTQQLNLFEQPKENNTVDYLKELNKQLDEPLLFMASELLKKDK